MNNLEDLKIYKEYLELIYYSEEITLKFPKYEKYSLVATIKNNNYENMRFIIKAQKEYNKVNRLNVLGELDVNIKMLKVLIRISYKRRYINSQNYAAWSRKIKNICVLLGAWISTCLKQ